MKRSYNVGFAILGEHSSYNAALGLARVIQERGHNVIFFVSDKTIFSHYVSMHGFKAENIPSGHELHIENPKRTARFRLWKRLRERAKNISLEQEILVDLIKSNSLDLCFLDVIRYDIYPIALALAKMSVPAMLLSCNFSSRFQVEYPPVFSSVIPFETKSPNLRSRITCALLWIWALGTRGRNNALGRLEYVEAVLAKWLDQMRNISFERELRKIGCRSTWSEWKRRPLIPEVVFGHRLLDWSAISSTPDRYYFSTADLFRKSPDFDWSGIEANKPIIYCNLSTISGFQDVGVSGPERPIKKPDLSKKRFRMAKRYLEAVIDCFSRREDWQLIIACGPFYQTLRGGAHTPNIHLFERLPQLAVLKRADVAITWGGAGTVRECINYGVPMLVFPAWSDQFGNAARITSRNIGFCGNILDITPRKVTELVESALTDKTVRAALLEIRKQCDANEEIEGLVQFVRRYTALRI